MIYLLHSTVPLSRVSGPVVHHYLGWCREGHLAERLKQHRSGHSKVKVLSAFLSRGGTLLLVATWKDGTREDERRLKRLGHLKRYCPVCTPQVPPAEERRMPKSYRPRALLISRSARPATPTGGAP